VSHFVFVKIDYKIFGENYGKKVLKGPTNVEISNALIRNINFAESQINS